MYIVYNYLFYLSFSRLITVCSNFLSIDPRYASRWHLSNTLEDSIADKSNDVVLSQTNPSMSLLYLLEKWTALQNFLTLLLYIVGLL